MYVHVYVCICMYYLYYVGMYTNEYVYDSICVYMRVFAWICLYMPVSVCMCMYFFFCFAQDAKGKRLPRPGPGALQCAVKKGIKCQQNGLDDSGTRTPVYRVTCVSIYHWANAGSDTWWNLGIFICQIKYIHIQTIHTYTCNTCNTCNTCTYSHIHACANHGREGSLGGCGRRCMSQEATKLPQ